MGERTKSIFKSVFKFLIAGGIIAWLLSTGRFDVKSAMALFQSPLVIVGVVLLTANLFAASERWRWLATSQGVGATSLSVFKLTLIGNFFNYAMPGGVGGDVVKAYYFGKDHPKARGAAITSVILDRVLGLYGMIFMAAVAMLWDYERVFRIEVLRGLLALMCVLWIGFTAAFIILFSRRLKSGPWIEKLLRKLPLSEKLLKLYETAHRFGLDRRRMILIFSLSIVSQMIAIVFLWVAGLAAGFGDVGLGTYFLVAPLGYMATAIPISPAGIGVGQAAFFLLFNLYLGRETNLGPAVITAQQAMTFLFGLGGVWIYLRRKDPVPENAAQN